MTPRPIHPPLRRAARFAVAAGLCAAAGLGLDSARAARIVCEEPVFDFGERAETETVTHVFTIRNAGRRVLTLYGFRESCGCAVSILSERRLPPGAESRVRVSLSLKGLRGRQRHTILIESSDRRTPRLVLALTGLVRTDVAMRPAQVFFGRLPPDGEASRDVAVEVEPGRRPVRVLRVEPDVEWIRADFESDGTEAGGGRIQIRILPPLPEGVIHATVRVETDHPDFPQLNLPVGAYVPAATAGPPPGPP